MSLCKSNPCVLRSGDGGRGVGGGGRGIMNFTFSADECGGWTAALIMKLLGTCNLCVDELT